MYLSIYIYITCVKVMCSIMHPLELRLLYFLTLVRGPRRSLRLELSDTRVYAPQIRARLGTTAHFCGVVVLQVLEVSI